MVETTHNQRPTFREDIEPLAIKHNSLVEDSDRYIGKKYSDIMRERQRIYAQMVDKTAEAILQAPQEERETILDTAIMFYARNPRVNISELSKLEFVKSIVLKTIEISESRSSKTPQK